MKMVDQSVVQRVCVTAVRMADGRAAQMAELLAGQMAVWKAAKSVEKSAVD